mgnify:CR=1 FL=1
MHEVGAFLELVHIIARRESKTATFDVAFVRFQL